jgi:hypothetical protein
MIKTLIGVVAALLLWQTGAAHAMQHDFSNTWCAHNWDRPGNDVRGRDEYYAWLEKCHRRHHTRPQWGLPEHDFTTLPDGTFLPLPHPRPPEETPQSTSVSLLRCSGKAIVYDGRTFMEVGRAPLPKRHFEFGPRGGVYYQGVKCLARWYEIPTN